MSRLMLAATLLLAARILGAQDTAADVHRRLADAMPQAEAARVLAAVDAARERDLPVHILQNLSLELLAKGVPAATVVAGVEQRLEQLTRARAALLAARDRTPDADEISAGSEAMRRGVTGEEIASLARSAPSGRSLAVPLFVISELIERGLPSDYALLHVRQRLLERAADAELARTVAADARGPGTVPVSAGRAARVPSAAGPPAWVPLPPRGRPVRPPAVPSRGQS